MSGSRFEIELLSKYNSSRNFDFIKIRGSNEVILFSLRDNLDKIGKFIEHNSLKSSSSNFKWFKLICLLFLLKFRLNLILLFSVFLHFYSFQVDNSDVLL